MCIGFPPFQGETREKLFHSIKTGSIDFTKAEWGAYSPHGLFALFLNVLLAKRRRLTRFFLLVKDLITKLLVHDPTKRLDVNLTLEHPWMQDPAVIARWKAVVNSHGPLFFFVFLFFRMVLFVFLFIFFLFVIFRSWNDASSPILENWHHQGL